MTNDPPLLEVVAVTKRFGPVVACNDISLQVAPGKVRGLLGQNGAGKSTLMKIVAGVVHQDAGEVRVHGEPLAPGDPPQAGLAGVGMVHQHLSLVGPLTVWENVTLGERGRIDVGAAVERVTELSDRFGLEVDPHAYVEDLSPGVRQRVEVIKCLRRDPILIVLDEPTSALSQAESIHLFDVLGSLVRDQGRSVILISHRLEEILNATDEVTILRDGAVVSTIPTAEADANLLASEMLGRSVSLEREGAAVGFVEADGELTRSGTADPVEQPTVTGAATAAPAPAVEIDGVSLAGPDGQLLLDRLSVHVRPGEIVGIAGVEGNGQAPLIEVLSGLVGVDSGAIRVGDHESGSRHSGSLSDVAVIPADRQGSGLVLEMTVAENLVLGRPGVAARHGVLSKRALVSRATRLIDDFAIATPSVHAPIWSLSGGNQQRVILARELSDSPKVLVAAQPTQGLDVGAMEDVWGRLRSAASAGTGVLLISTDLDEILALADRVAVIYRGRIVGEMDRGQVDTERLGLLMGGVAS